MVPTVALKSSLQPATRRRRVRAGGHSVPPHAHTRNVRLSRDQISVQGMAPGTSFAAVDDLAPAHEERVIRHDVPPSKLMPAPPPRPRSNRLLSARGPRRLPDHLRLSADPESRISTNEQLPASCSHRNAIPPPQLNFATSWATMAACTGDHEKSVSTTSLPVPFRRWVRLPFRNACQMLGGRCFIDRVNREDCEDDLAVCRVVQAHVGIGTHHANRVSSESSWPAGCSDSLVCNC